MKTCDLTACERAALAYLRVHGPARLSSIGYHILDVVPGSVDRKRNPSPQGVALFAGRFVRTLSVRDLAYPDKNGWSISNKGRDHLANRKPTQAPAIQDAQDKEES